MRFHGAVCSQCRRQWRLSIGLLCILSGAMSFGCGASSVTFTVTKCDRSKPGYVRLGLRIHESLAEHDVVVLQRVGKSDICTIEAFGNGGKIEMMVHTGTLPGVRLFVGEGESFVLACGRQKRLLQFHRERGDVDEVVEYVIVVRPSKTCRSRNEEASEGYGEKHCRSVPPSNGVCGSENCTGRAW